MRKRFICWLCAILFTVLSLGDGIALAAAAPSETEYFRQNFSSCANEKTFSDAHTDFGISYVTGKMQVKDHAVRIHTCDMRWWSLNYSDTEMHFDFSLSFDEHYSDTVLYFNVQNHTPSTTTESHNGGLVVAVRSRGGKPVLTDRKGRRLMTFPTDGTVHSVRVEMYYGSKTYSIYCDDKLLADDCTFVSPMYSVLGARFHGDSITEDSYLTLDNLRFTAKGRSYAQKFSYQEPGDLPEIEIPAPSPDEGITVWYNGVKADCPIKPVFKDGDVLLPTDWVISLLGEATEAIDGGTLSVRRLPALYDAKIWLDETHDMLIITTGEQKEDNLLRKYGSVLVMNGQPYYEISFNKFDLNWQIAADPSFNGGKSRSNDYPDSSACLAGAEEALKQLSENGFRTIRVFCSNINMDRSEAEREAFFAAADKMYDLCDQYGVQVVASLGLISDEFLEGSYVEGKVWVNGSETFYDLFCDPTSASRQNVYEFLDAYISRYKDRDTVLMWEIQNEGNLGADIGTQVQHISYSLAQLAAYYGDIADRIRENDPDRLITGGDSILRSAQWNLFTGTMRGSSSPDWSTDTWEERLKCLALLHSKLDVISIHGYSVGYSEHYINKQGIAKFTDWELFLDEAERLGLALYNGETGGMLTSSGEPVGEGYGNTGKISAEARARYLDRMIEDGVQLTHWWAFHSDRRTVNNDVDSFGIRVDDDTAATFAIIREANEKLQKKYGVNLLAPSDESSPSQEESSATDFPELRRFLKKLVNIFS